MTKDALHDQTRAAVIQLLAEGKKPSWRAVRDITGSGSSTDITRRISSVLVELAENSLLGDYPEEVQSAFAHFWRAAKVAAGNEFEAQRQELELRTTNAEAESENFRRQLHATQDSLKQCLNQQAEQVQTIRSQENVISSQQETLRHLEEQGKRLELEVQQSRKQLDDARTEHQAAMAATVARYQQSIAETAVLNQTRFDSLEAALKREKDRYSADTKMLLVKIDEARQESKQERRELQSSLTTANNAIDELRNLLSDARENEARLKGRKDSLELDVKSARDKLDSSEQQIAQLKIRIQQLEECNSELNGQVKAGATLLEEERSRSQELANKLEASHVGSDASSAGKIK